MTHGIGFTSLGMLVFLLSGCQLGGRQGPTSLLSTDPMPPSEGDGERLEVVGGGLEEFEAPLGPFKVKWQGAKVGAGKLSVYHERRPGALLWDTVSGEAFVAAGLGDAEFHEKRGSFRISDHYRLLCLKQVVEEGNRDSQQVFFRGSFRDENCPLTWKLSFSLIDGERLGFRLEISGAKEPAQTRALLRYASRAEEHFFGFGMQFSAFDLKGKLLPVLSQEEGVGRGRNPLSFAANLLFGKGVAGDWWTSYGAVPQYISSDLRSLYIDETNYSVFDMREDDRVTLAIMGERLSGAVLAGDHVEKLLDVYTRYSGRMQSLPTWVDRGAIIGVQGGTARVRTIYQKLKASGVEVSALWIQDWVGRRKTSFGSQLWWNWELDQESYGDFKNLVADLARDGVRVLTYVNPFLVDTSAKGHVQRHLFQEAEARQFLVKDKNLKPYMIQNTSFSAGLLDLSQPAARKWMIDILKSQVIGVGAKGWMADFGEALPFDAVLSKGTAISAHNAYPEEWAALNREALLEAGLWEEGLIFSRSAYSKSPGKTRLFWLGDQLVSWDDRDGIKTALTGLLSSGLSGFSLNHSDTGGYTTIDHPLMAFRRSPELLRRWTEMNAFTAILRTHEGNIPEVNAQVYDDPESLQHFSKFSKVYRILAPYRRDLMIEAEKTGLPLVRPTFLHYPGDPKTFNLVSQFLLGRNLLVAPVLDEGAKKVQVYIPDDGWIHLPTGRVYKRGDHEVAAQLGSPAVFWKVSLAGEPDWVAELRGLLRVSS